MSETGFDIVGVLKRDQTQLSWIEIVRALWSKQKEEVRMTRRCPLAPPSRALSPPSGTIHH